MTTTQRQYKPTEAKYKGGAHEMYVTYDLPRATRGGAGALAPKVKRVYIAGQVKDWALGDFAKRTGRKVHGVKIDYAQTRSAYARQSYTARRDGAATRVAAGRVPRSQSNFSQIVEVPKTARNVHFYKGRLPRKYQSALQNVR